MGHAAMLKEVPAHATVNHNVGGSDHGMSLTTKASFGFMAHTKMMQSSVIMTCMGNYYKNDGYNTEDNCREDEVGGLNHGGERNG